MTPECHRLAARLERARLMRRWSEVLAVAEQLQSIQATPGDGVACGLRANAESARSQANGFDLHERPAVLPIRPHDRTRTATWLQKWWSLAFPAGDAMRAQAMTHADATMRFLLWVDAVGGYLVSTRDELVIGQPAPGQEVDIPIRGDLSRRHAVIHRDGEGYLLEPVREVQINSKRQERTVSLNDGDLLTLGESVKLRFRRPHPLSQTARLEFLSYHRTQPATDGVLLMAESCILGPGAASHVVCPNWPHDVVLYRHGSALGCRSPKPFRIDGVEQQGRGPLGERSQVAGQDFSFSVEPA
jgi:hypothetical protein